MANRRYDQFPAGTYNPTDIILQADPNTGDLEKIELQDIPSGSVADEFLAYMQAAGSDVIALTAGLTLFDIQGTQNMSDGLLRAVPVILPAAVTITGLYIFLTTQGNYTADNYNGVGLYKNNSGSLDLVASSADDGDIWKAASNSWVKKAFSATYDAAPGVYMAAFLYNSSAQVTAPAYGRSVLQQNSAINDTIMPAAGLLYRSASSLAALPDPLVTGSSVNNGPFIALY